jgi:lipopolysaccharide export system protein LptC
MLFPLLLLAALAALTYWLDHTMQSPDVVRDKRQAHEPDYTVENLIATRLNVDGRVHDTLRTAVLLHYPDDDSTHLTAPQFASYAHGTPLSITAREGEISSNGGNLYFRGDVRATRAAQGGNGALVVTTEYLHVLPDDNIAKTDHAVTIREDGMTISAGGMELNSERRLLKLHAGVRAVYHIARPPVP